MDTKKFEVLLETVSAGSLNKAAEKLNYTQSGLVYMMNTLEQEVGIPLLSRDFKGVSLTQEGKQLESFIRDVVEKMARFEEELAKITNNKLSDLFIGAYPSIARHWLPDIIKDFLKDNPGTNIHIRVGVEDIPRWLDEDIISLAIGEPGIVGDNKWIHLQDKEVYVAVPASSSFPADEPVILEDLMEYPVLLPTYNPRSAGNAVLRNWATSRNMVESFTVSAPDGSTLLSMVGSGLGITFLSSLYKYECPNTVRMLPLDPPIVREIGFILKPQKAMTLLMKEFIDFTHKHI